MTEVAGPTSEPGISGSGQAKLDTVILWCRRDLRVTDNTALTAALQLGKNVVRTSLCLPADMLYASITPDPSFSPRMGDCAGVACFMLA